MPSEKPRTRRPGGLGEADLVQDLVHPLVGHVRRGGEHPQVVPGPPPGMEPASPPASRPTIRRGRGRFR